MIIIVLSEQNDGIIVTVVRDDQVDASRRVTGRSKIDLENDLLESIGDRLEDPHRMHS